MKLTKVKIKDIVEAPFNYNKHPEAQIDELIKSLDHFDQFKNIVVWQGQVIAGNGLVKALRKRGGTEVDALVMDHLTEEQAKKLCVLDNAAPAGAEPDGVALKELLDSISDPLDIPGVDEDWIESILSCIPSDVIHDSFFEEKEDEDEDDKEDEEEERDGMCICPRCGEAIYL